MAEVTEKKQRYKRGENPKSLANLKPSRPGMTNNPNGNLNHTKHRSTTLKKWADVKLEIVNPITKKKEKATVEDEVVLSWIREARKGNMQAINAFFDTLYGKIADKTELTGAGGKDLMPKQFVVEVIIKPDDGNDNTTDEN